MALTESNADCLARLSPRPVLDHQVLLRLGPRLPRKVSSLEDALVKVYNMGFLLLDFMHLVVKIEYGSVELIYSFLMPGRYITDSNLFFLESSSFHDLQHDSLLYPSVCKYSVEELAPLLNT